MKVFGRFLSVLVSFAIFVVLLFGIVVFIGKKVVNDKLDNYLNDNDILILEVSSIINEDVIELKDDTNLKDVVLQIGINNNYTEEEINELLVNVEFNNYLKSLYKKTFVNEDIEFNINHLVNEGFLSDLDNMFKQNEITHILGIKTTTFIFIILGLTLLTILLSFSLYHPFLYLGIPSLIIGSLLLIFKYNSNILIDLLVQTLSIEESMLNSLLIGIIDYEGLIMLMFGLVLIIIFVIIKIILNKRKKLEETRRINIEDIHI